MAQSDIERTLALLDDPRFIALRRCADQDVLLWSNLADLEMPDGLSREDAWRLLTSIRRQTAFQLPWKSYLDIGYSTDTWYATTRSMARIINEFEGRCRAGSALDRVTQSFAGSNQLMAQWEIDLKAAFAWEGIEVDGARIHAIFSGESTGTENIDRIIENVHDILLDIDVLAHRRISPGLIENLYYRVMDGAEDVEEGTRKRLYQPRADSEYHDPDTCTKMICTIASDKYDNLLLHPLLKLVSIQWLFNDFAPVPSFNALIELVLRHTLLVRWGYPVLRWVPMYPEGDLLDYGHGETDLNPAEVLESTERDCGYGLDTTPAFHLRLEALLAKLDGLEKLCGSLQQMEETVDELFRNDPNINLRQKIILVNALQSPLAAQRIESHRKRFRIAYATARSDFLDLAARGFLVKGTDGHAFVFRAHPDLQHRMEELQAKRA